MSTVPQAAPRAATGPGGGKIVLGVIGALLTLIGLGLLAGGGTVLWANASQRDDGGFFTSSPSLFASPGFAVTSERLRLVNGLPDRLSSPGDVVTFKAQGGSSNGKPLFVGIAPAADVTAYLSGVAHDEVVHVHMDGWKGPLSKDYRTSPGGPPAGPPAAQPFWTAKTTGTAVSLTWPASEGTWSIVVMNADASADVAADLALGVKVNFLGWVALGLLCAGGVFLLAGVTMMFFGFRSPPTGAGSSAAAAALPAGQLAFETDDEKGYPVLIQGELDPNLSRWLWLVKWLLAIPHYIVLAFLWLAAVLLTVLAFFAILFTGRFPRGIFDFNVGVLRWTWRVAFYSYSVLGTDRYPPFTLADVDYPARFDVPYPEHLSRGLVLVKSWLLAIPHYIILTLLIGSWGWTFGNGRWLDAVGPSLNGILVLFAAVILLFTGRYPRDIFGIVLGINRWALRVAAYAMLMRDEYPPFRLDR